MILQAFLRTEATFGVVDSFDDPNSGLLKRIPLYSCMLQIRDHMFEVLVQEVDALSEAGGNVLPSLECQLQTRHISIVCRGGVEDIPDLVLE
jgi:hypothetical protein